MDFRWVVAITLWTMLSGPVFAEQTPASPPPQGQVVATAAPAIAR
jgi:hypothetical protein